MTDVRSEEEELVVGLPLLLFIKLLWFKKLNGLLLKPILCLDCVVDGIAKGGR